MFSPEEQGKITLWRQKAAEGTLTADEMKEAITLLRQGRLNAQVSSDSSRAKRARKEIKSADEMLGELGL